MRNAKLPLFEVISVPPFQAILVEPWNAPAHRYFLAYRTLGNFIHLMGNGVVDEFSTFSTPIFIGPRQLLGQLYNVGITLGHQRNPEMPLDQGWPPFCVGIQSDDAPPKGWDERLLRALQQTPAKIPVTNPENFDIQNHRYGEVEIYATSAPLLPRQLQRVCQLSRSPMTIAFATGNRISGKKGKLLSVQVLAEATFEQLLHRFSTEFSDA